MTEQKTPTELGTQPVGKLLMQYAIPAIIAMTASSLYNMVDSIFIGQGVGALAISGLAITFPLMNLSAAFGAMVGVGGSTLISVKLGQKDYKVAQNVLGNVVTMNLINGILLGALCLLFMDPILYFFGASENTIDYAREYMRIIMLGNVITHSYLGLNAILRSAGHPRKAMGATIFTVVINTILDPIFIYTFDMGIAGAAWATVLGQAIALVYQLQQFRNKKELMHFMPGIYRLRRTIVANTLSIGMSPFLMNLCACMIVIIINNSLASHGGDLGIGAYGIINRIAFIFVMLVIGLNQGMQPIAGYNFGARLFNRVTRVLKYTIIGATCITTSGFLIGTFLPDLCARMFTSDPELISIVHTGMPIVMIFFPLIGFQMATTNFFQSIGMVKKSIFLSLTRQLLFLLPLILILPHFLGINGVWWSMAGSDIAASAITAVLLIRQKRIFEQQKQELSTTNPQ